MFQYRGEWHDLRGSHRIATGIYDAAMKIIVECGGHLFFHGIDTVRLRARYHNPLSAHVISLQSVLEAVHAYADSIGDRVTVIADEVPDQAAYEARIAQLKMIGTLGHKNAFLGTIELPFRWEDSRRHRNLQAIDMATFIYRRHDAHRETRPATAHAVERIKRTIMKATLHEHVWLP